MEIHVCSSLSRSDYWMSVKEIILIYHRVTAHVPKDWTVVLLSGWCSNTWKEISLRT